MDNESLKKINEFYQERRALTSRKITTSKDREKFENNIETIYQEFIKNTERNLDSSGLLNDSSYEFLHSEAPVTYSEIQKFVETHGEDALYTFLHASARSHDETLDILSAKSLSDEEKSDEISQTSQRRNSHISGQKDDDQRKDKSISSAIHEHLVDYIRSVQAVAIRTTYARDISDRSSYFTNLSKNEISEAAKRIADEFKFHTDVVYSIIETELETYDTTVKQELGIESKDKQSEEPVFTQELADYFASGNVDITKLSPQECTWYLNYLFDGELPKIQTNDKGVLDTSTKDEVEPLPTSVFDEPSPFAESATPAPLDIAPELRPLAPDVLAEYQQNVSKGLKEIEEKKDSSHTTNRDENNGKDDNSLPDIDLF